MITDDETELIRQSDELLTLRNQPRKVAYEDNEEADLLRERINKAMRSIK